MTTETPQEQASLAWSGWVFFAALILFTVGFIDVVQGFTALFKEEVLLITESGLLVVADYTAWGVVLLVWGAVLVLAALGLLSGRGWARWFAIVVVVLNMVVQMAWFPAFPLWSLVAIGLGATVMFALTVRWADAREGLRSLS